MSVIMAFASMKAGVVASDGRELDGIQARVVDGRPVPVEENRVSTDERDKTFVLNGGTVIGVHCGLMSFSGKSIPQHLNEITANTPGGPLPFQKLIDAIRKHLAERLEKDDIGVLFQCRGVSLLLIGNTDDKKAKMVITKLLFTPQGNKIETLVEEKQIGKGYNYYMLCGDDDACRAADSVVAAEMRKLHTGDFLKTVAIKGIKKGIEKASLAENSNIATCGGTIFTKVRKAQ